MPIEELTCVVCYEKENLGFLNCKHILCEKCYIQMRLRDNGTEFICPYCRATGKGKDLEIAFYEHVLDKAFERLKMMTRRLMFCDDEFKTKIHQRIDVTENGIIIFIHGHPDLDDDDPHVM